MITGLLDLPALWTGVLDLVHAFAAELGGGTTEKSIEGGVLRSSCWPASDTAQLSQMADAFARFQQDELVPSGRLP